MESLNPSPEGFRAELERLEYVPASNTPSHRPHQFVYYICLTNDTLRPIRVTGRKWVLTNRENHKLVVEGDGVVGEFPLLAPGESFHYHSYHLIDTDSTAVGAYFADDEDGNRITAKLASFCMEVPHS
jgi:ApaG protein